MSSFDDVLRHLAAHLDLPADARREVLAELAADLDGLYAEARAAGLDDAAARARALAFADLGDAARAALVSVHGPLHRRWGASLSATTRTTLARVALGLALVAVLYAWAVLVGAGAARALGSWTGAAGQALTLVALAPLALGAWRARVTRDHRPGPQARLATVTAWLGGLNALFAAALLVRSAWAARAALAGPAPDVELAVGPGALPPELLAHLAQLRLDAAVVATGLVGVLLAAFAWRRLALRAHGFQVEEDELLDAFSPPSPAGDPASLAS